MNDATMNEQGRKRVRVVVADDHPLYREGVVRALLASGNVEIVAEAEDGRSALAEIQKHQPDVALLDYKMPSVGGAAVTRAARPRSAARSSRRSSTTAAVIWPRATTRSTA